MFRALPSAGWKKWPRRRFRRRRPTNCHGAVPGGQEEKKKPGIRPDAPSRSDGIRSGNRPRLRKRRPSSRASAVPHGGGRVRSLSRCLGADPQRREEGKTRARARICLLRQASAPPAAKPAEPQASISLDTPAQKGCARGVPDPLGGEQAHRLRGLFLKRGYPRLPSWRDTSTERVTLRGKEEVRPVR
jgi:hypothetical protein